MLRETEFPRQPQQYFEGITEAEISILQILSNAPLNINSVWLAQWEGPNYLYHIHDSRSWHAPLGEKEGQFSLLKVL